MGLNATTQKVLGTYIGSNHHKSVGLRGLGSTLQHTNTMLWDIARKRWPNTKGIGCQRPRFQVITDCSLPRVLVGRQLEEEVDLFDRTPRGLVIRDAIATSDLRLKGCHSNPSVTTHDPQSPVIGHHQEKVGLTSQTPRVLTSKAARVIWMSKFDYLSHIALSTSRHGGAHYRTLFRQGKIKNRIYMSW